MTGFCSGFAETCGAYLVRHSRRVEAGGHYIEALRSVDRLLGVDLFVQTSDVVIAEFLL